MDTAYAEIHTKIHKTAKTCTMYLLNKSRSHTSCVFSCVFACVFFFLVYFLVYSRRSSENTRGVPWRIYMCSWLIPMCVDRDRSLLQNIVPFIGLFCKRDLIRVTYLHVLMTYSNACVPWLVQTATHAHEYISKNKSQHVYQGIMALCVGRCTVTHEPTANKNVQEWPTVNKNNPL